MILQKGDRIKVTNPALGGLNSDYFEDNGNIFIVLQQSETDIMLNLNRYKIKSVATGSIVEITYKYYDIILQNDDLPEELFTL